MASTGDIVAGLGGSLLSGIAGLFSGPQKSTTNSTQTQTTQSNQNLYGTTANTHVYDPAQTNLKNYLTNLYAQQLMAPLANTQGIIAQQIQGNNTNANASQMAVSHLLAARGLNTSPVAANALIQNEGVRQGANSTVMQNAPLMQEQLLMQRLQQAGGFFNSMPTDTISQTQQSGDQYSTGTSTGHSETVGSANPVQSGVSSLGTSLAYLSGKGIFGK